MASNKKQKRIGKARNSPLPPVTIQELDNIDRSLLKVVKEGFRRINDVMDGKITWSTVQFRIFQTCLNKIRPDLKSTHHLIDDQRKPVDEMSREEVFAHLARLKEEEAAVEDAKLIAAEDAKAPPIDVEFEEIAPSVGVSLNEN